MLDAWGGATLSILGYVESGAYLGSLSGHRVDQNGWFSVSSAPIGFHEHEQILQPAGSIGSITYHAVDPGSYRFLLIGAGALSAASYRITTGGGEIRLVASGERTWYYDGHELTGNASIVVNAGGPRLTMDARSSATFEVEGRFIGFVHRPSTTTGLATVEWRSPTDAATCFCAATALWESGPNGPGIHTIWRDGADADRSPRPLLVGADVLLPTE